MKIITTVSEMQQQADDLRKQGRTIGFVPTMGYLHEGHLSLIRTARSHADTVVVSVFVNPTQFGPNEDFASYPRDIEGDEEKAEKAGADIVFYPEAEEMYGPGFSTSVQVEGLTNRLCGASRPGHFKGVTTVVSKLFLIVKPHLAVFGQKDAQQAAVIRQMVSDLNFDISIITAPIVREHDGLAMSSRNKYLSAQERKQALALHDALESARKMAEHGETKAAVLILHMQQRIEREPDARIDYIEIVDTGTLEPVSTVHIRALAAVAVYIGSTRLIDNCVLG